MEQTWLDFGARHGRVSLYGKLLRIAVYATTQTRLHLNHTEGMLNLWTLGGLSWRGLLWRTVRESWEDEVFGQAARMAFYHLLALFPALLLAVLLLIKLERTGSLLLETLDSSLQRIFPPGGSGIVIGFLDDLKSRSAASEVGFAVVGWLWAAFNGTWALISD